MPNDPHPNRHKKAQKFFIIKKFKMYIFLFYINNINKLIILCIIKVKLDMQSISPMKKNSLTMVSPFKLLN